MNTVIGGDFYFRGNNYNNDNILNFLSGLKKNMYLFSTGRDALFSVYKKLSGKRIWIPDFLCEAVFQPLRDIDSEICFYHIGIDLKSELNFQPKTDDFVLIINYFGFFDENLYSFCKIKGCGIISDVTHIIFDKDKMSEISDLSYFVIGSLRKFFASPDGAFLLSESEAEIKNEYRYEFLKMRTYGFFSRFYSSINGFNNDENLLFLKGAEKLLDESDDYGFSIGYLSENILKSFSVDDYSEKIKSNFNYLNSVFETEYNFFSPYFPLIFSDKEKRDLYRKKLFSEKIFVPVHWDTEFLGDKKNILSDIIFSVPCDYRYDSEDMKKVSENIERKDLL